MLSFVNDRKDGSGRTLSRVFWWLLPLIVAAIAVALVAAFRDGDGTNPAYPLY